MKLYSPQNFKVQKLDILKGFDTLLQELDERKQIDDDREEADETFLEVMSELLSKEEFQKKVAERNDWQSQSLQRRKEIEDLRKIFASDVFGEIPKDVLERTSTLFKENLLRSAIWSAHCNKACDMKNPAQVHLEEIERFKIRVVAYGTAYGTLMRDMDEFEAFQVYPFGNMRF